MVFKFHTAFALGLIALVAGTYLIAKVRTEGMCCKGFARVVGWFVVITAFLGLVCSTYYSFRYWETGSYCPSKMWRGKHMMMKHHGMPLMEGPSAQPMKPMMKMKMKMEEEEEGDED